MGDGEGVRRAGREEEGGGASPFLAWGVLGKCTGLVGRGEEAGHPPRGHTLAHLLGHHPHILTPGPHMHRQLPRIGTPTASQTPSHSITQVTPRATNTRAEGHGHSHSRRRARGQREGLSLHRTSTAVQHP